MVPKLEESAMKNLASVALSLLLLAFAVPSAANHDQGQGKSQDHLHRRDSVPAAQVPEPSSAILLTVGGVLLLLGAGARGVFKTQKPANA